MGDEFREAIQNMKFDFISSIKNDIELAETGLNLSESLQTVFDSLSKVDYIVNARTIMQMTSIINLETVGYQTFETFKSDYKAKIADLELVLENLEEVKNIGETLKEEYCAPLKNMLDKEVSKNSLLEDDKCTLEKRVYDKIQNEINKRISTFAVYVKQFQVLKNKCTENFSKFQIDFFNEMKPSNIKHFQDCLNSIEKKQKIFQANMKTEIETFHLPISNINQITDEVENEFKEFIDKSRKDFEKIYSLCFKCCDEFVSEYIKIRRQNSDCYLVKDSIEQKFRNILEMSSKNKELNLNYHQYTSIYDELCKLLLQHFYDKNEKVKDISVKVTKILKDYINCFKHEFSTDDREQKCLSLETSSRYIG